MPSGIIYVLKPAGMPSGGVVGHIKHITGEKRVGHAGTLDPGAAGVLPVCFGRATRLSGYLTDGRKKYIAELMCGTATDTLDSYGKVVEKCSCDIKPEQVLSVLSGFTGEQFQVAPAYSAVKIGGCASYKLARKGIIVEKPPRRVYIYDIKLLAQTEKNRFLLEIDCGSGTYVRTLLSDIGKKIGVFAHTSFLLRAMAGGRSAEQSCTLEELKEASEQGELSKYIVSAEAALSEMPETRLPGHRAEPMKNGLISDTSAGDGIYRLYCGAEFLGIGKVTCGEARLITPLWG